MRSRRQSGGVHRECEHTGRLIHVAGNAGIGWRRDAGDGAEARERSGAGWYRGSQPADAVYNVGTGRLREPAVAQEVWQPGDELIVAWRALTLALMDEVAREVRKMLHKDEKRLPLACVLEGGSWAAGRALAERVRGGLPPLQVASDGTVF